MILSALGGRDKVALLPKAPQGNTVRGPGPYGAIGEAAPHECAALSTEGRGQHLCNHKRASWSLHQFRAHGSPGGVGAEILMN